MTIRTLFVCLSTIYLAVCSLATNAQIERVEPPFWWAGMNSSELQLMVHGNNIADMTVRSSVNSVKVQSTERTENANYLFVNLALGSKLRASTINLTFTQKDGAEFVYGYEFKQRRKYSADRQGFSAKDVIYLVTPDRFANGDPDNDQLEHLFEGVDRSNPDGRHGGDLLGLTNNIGYLSELGITQVWLNPLQENNQEAYSYHGYSISDLYNIDARFGGNEALLKWVEAARELGIGLIMDTIPNHIGLNHWWMDDLPSQDWVNNGGNFMPTSHRHEMIQDPYASQVDKAAFNDGWFVPTMPDLNQRNSKLATYLIQNNIWWVEFADLSGLRVDTLPYADKHFTARFSRRILQEYPKLNIVGEEWTTNPALVSYWQSGKNNIDGYSANIPSLMDFPLQDALIKALTEPRGRDAGLNRLHALLANDFQYPNASNLVVIGDNHDMSRLFTLLDEDIALYKMALVYLMTTRGIPQLFYGTEILMHNRGSDAHGVIRSDFPGGWMGDKMNAFNGENMPLEALNAQRFVSKLLNWRKSALAVHTGKLTHFFPEEDVYTYFRHNESAKVMVVINKSDSERNITTARFGEITAGVVSKRNALTGKISSYGSSIVIPAKSVLLLDLLND